MKIYLKGYYGYKNRGDELLLLGLIYRLYKEYNFTQLIIESGNKKFLSQWIQNCKKIVKWTCLDNILCVEKNNMYAGKQEFLHVFGGGEVFSDARPFPYNGWNYFLGFLRIILQKNFIVVGGIGTEKKWGTKFLYTYLLGYAQRVVVRDEGSYQIARRYCLLKDLELFHDFAYDILDIFSGKKNKKKRQQVSRQDVKKMSNMLNITDPYILININIYMRNKDIMDKCRQLVKKYPKHNYYFFSAALGSDENMFDDLKEIVPGLQIYTWAQYNLYDIIGFIQGASFVLASRLHVLLVAQYFNIPFDALVYQEKIEKVILGI